MGDLVRYMDMVCCAVPAALALGSLLLPDPFHAVLRAVQFSIQVPYLYIRASVALFLYESLHDVLLGTYRAATLALLCTTTGFPQSQLVSLLSTSALALLSVDAKNSRRLAPMMTTVIASTCITNANRSLAFLMPLVLHSILTMALTIKRVPMIAAAVHVGVTCGLAMYEAPSRILTYTVPLTDNLMWCVAALNCPTTQKKTHQIKGTRADMRFRMTVVTVILNLLAMVLSVASTDGVAPTVDSTTSLLDDDLMKMEQDELYDSYNNDDTMAPTPCNTTLT